jgi:stearoyl-CoA desaturase (Delta-9 desaturase)
VIAEAASRADVEPVAHENLDRLITGLVTVVPVLLLGVAAWQVWDRVLGWHDPVVFAVLYLATGLGVTVGFHRLTHRSFETSRGMRAALAILGSAAVEGPVIPWVAGHRKHHTFSDGEGDPHSPHVGHGGGLRGALRALLHAHLGWLFVHTHRASMRRYAPDLLAASFGLGVALGGRVGAGLTALLWGGGVRTFLVHHVTYSINSLRHTFGRRAFDTDDHSRNLAWLALPALGESWHNNHHAFPTSAVHGLGRRQPDPSAWVITGLERLGLVWNVVSISPEGQRAGAAR